MFRMTFSWLVLLLIWNCCVLAQDGCVCPPLYPCRNAVNTGGIGLINARINTNQCCCNDESATSIKKDCGYRNPNGVGGNITKLQNDEAHFGEFPWMVAIFRKQLKGAKHFYKCGGSLIHPRVVLTAAHCISGVGDKFRIRAGEWNSRRQNEPFKHQNREASSVVIHPQYNSHNLYNDIGLLFLERGVTLADHINIACLPPQGFIASGGGCFVTGWGADRFESKDGHRVILKKMELPVVERQSCENAVKKILSRPFSLHASFMCAGGEEGKDACTGDGGGPLVCPIGSQQDRFQQVGIVSWGIGCGLKDVPGGYVDVGYFRNWIDQELNKKNLFGIK